MPISGSCRGCSSGPPPWPGRNDPASRRIRALTLSKAIFNDRQPRRTSQSEFLVLATEVEGVGGIERATSRLIAALTEQCGAARVHVLSLWGDRQQPDSKDRRPSIAHDDRSPRS